MKKPQQVLILFGSKHDPEVQASINRAAITGRKVVLKPTPNYDTNQGKCGRLCHCKHVCALAYEGDTGATMGTSY